MRVSRLNGSKKICYEYLLGKNGSVITLCGTVIPRYKVLVHGDKDISCSVCKHKYSLIELQHTNL